MKLILPLLLSSQLVAQQCIEVQMLKPIKVEAEALKIGPDDGPEEEYFEKFGEHGWSAGSTKGGERIGTWWHWQDEENWKKVTYRDGQAVFWQKLVAGRRLFEITFQQNIMEIGWGKETIFVYELCWNSDKTLEWRQVDTISKYVVNEHAHFIDIHGKPNVRRSYFGTKYNHGDQFDESIMGVPQK